MVGHLPIPPAPCITLHRDSQYQFNNMRTKEKKRKTHVFWHTIIYSNLLHIQIQVFKPSKSFSTDNEGVHALRMDLFIWLLKT